MMCTISDLYRRDLPDNAILVPYDAVTNSCDADTPIWLANKRQYIFDDFTCTNRSEMVAKGERYLSVLGDHLRVSLLDKPNDILVDHWAKKLHQRYTIRIADFGDCAPHIVRFPLESLPRELHCVDPDVHYQIHSKAFIGQIDCPQAAILDHVVAPSVMKACRSNGANGTWFLHNLHDYERRQQWVQEHLPRSETVLTEMVDDVRSNYSVHFYIDRKGRVELLGAGEQCFNRAGIFVGGTINFDEQEAVLEQLASTLRPVTAALHKVGFFGTTGVDVLVDGQGRQYVIDINPRLTTCLPQILAERHLRATGKGWSVSVLLKGCKFVAKSLGDIVAMAEAVDEADVIIQSASVSTTYITCQICFFSNSFIDCRKIIKQLLPSYDIPDLLKHKTAELAWRMDGDMNPL